MAHSVIFGRGRAVSHRRDLPLYNLNNLTYLGEWFLPGGGSGGARFDGGLGVSALNTANNNNSLFMAGHIGENMVAEVSRPAFNGTATIIQDFVDLPAKLAVDPTVDTAYLGGMHVHGNKLLVSYYEFYDADSSMTLSHFMLDSLTLATANASPMYNTADGAAGQSAGHMIQMPSYWKNRIGKQIITGLGGGIPITNRASAGPAAFGINPDELSETSTPTQPMVVYPFGHDIDTASPSQKWVKVTENRGCWVPPGTRSLIFFGSHGTGQSEYGQGTTDSGLHGTPVPGGGTGATGTANISNGVVTGVTVTAGGSGYGAAPGVRFTGGGGSGAVGHGNTTGGVITSVTIEDGGAGYTSAPSVAFADTFYIYDPDRLDKGYHAWPYDSWYWHYDLNDIMRVVNGQIDRWEPQPISYGSFDLHSAQADPRVGSVHFDEINQRLVITERKRNAFDKPGVLEFSI